MGENAVDFAGATHGSQWCFTVAGATFEGVGGFEVGDVADVELGLLGVSERCGFWLFVHSPSVPVESVVRRG